MSTTTTAVATMDAEQMISVLETGTGGSVARVRGRLTKMAGRVEKHRRPIMDAQAKAEGKRNLSPTAQWMTSRSIEVLTSRQSGDEQAKIGSRGILRWLVEYDAENCREASAPNAESLAAGKPQGSLADN